MTNIKKNKVKLATYSLALALCFPRMTAVHALRSSEEVIDEIENESYKVDELGTYILQGVCTVNGNIYITAYDSSRERNNSKVIILDENKELICEKYIYNNAHVGGICYDDKNKIIWITDKSGCISGFNQKDFESDLEVIEPKFKKVKVSTDFINIYGNNAVAYITYHNGRIYVGNYNSKMFSRMKSYEVLNNGCINLDSVEEYKFVDYVQGITFYEANDEEYLLVSSSYGPFSKSVLKIFKFNNEIKDFNEEKYTECRMPRMMEQITTIPEDKLITIFESNAKKYRIYGPTKNDMSVYDLKEIKRKL